MKEKVFLCSFCGKQIKTNKANLIRHEQTHETVIEKIKCAGENCTASFKQKSDYYRHWNNTHGYKIMPDGLNYVTEKNHAQKQKYVDTEARIDEYRPKFNDFLVLNYLGLTHTSGKITKLNYPRPEPSFGKLVFNDYNLS